MINRHIPRRKAKGQGPEMLGKTCRRHVVYNYKIWRKRTHFKFVRSPKTLRHFALRPLLPTTNKPLGCGLRSPLNPQAYYYYSHCMTLVIDKTKMKTTPCSSSRDFPGNKEYVCLDNYLAGVRINVRVWYNAIGDCPGILFFHLKRSRQYLFMTWNNYLSWDANSIICHFNDVNDLKTMQRKLLEVFEKDRSVWGIEKKKLKWTWLSSQLTTIHPRLKKI